MARVEVDCNLKNCAIFSNSSCVFREGTKNLFWFVFPRRKPLYFLPGFIRAISCYKTVSLSNIWAVVAKIQQNLCDSASLTSCNISISAKGIGCFKDKGRRAITPLEGRSRLLRGSYRRRRYAIEKCALASIRRGFRVFAIQNGGWCASTRTAHLTYRKYGRSNRCRYGKGGPWANNVYVLRGLWMHFDQ